MEDSMEIPLKSRHKSIIWPSNPTPRHTPWGNRNWNRHLYPIVHCSTVYSSFPHSSVAKESVCNAGDPSSIPRSGRSTGEGIGYPLQYACASLGAYLVKSPPAMQETWVWSLGWEDSLEKGKLLTPVSWPGLENSQRQIQLNDFHFHSYHLWPLSLFIF